MIAFRPLTLEDHGQIHGLLSSCAYPGADYTFNNMYFWSCYYGEFGYAAGMLTQHITLPDFEDYLYPAGPGDVKAALAEIMEDARARGGRLRLRGLTGDRVRELEACFPGQFTVRPYRGSFDYIYTVEELTELKGKKLQSKRNHCNRFQTVYPDWYTEPITGQNLPACRALCEQWYALHVPGSEQERLQLQLERVAIARAFEGFTRLGMDGLLLSDGERFVAFSMGVRMNRTYYDVNFEKALTNVAGAYSVINREFSRMVAEKYPEVEYLNREDDMDQEGLRRAKESYQPTILLEKFTAERKETL